MLRPFAKSTVEGTLRDPTTGASIPIKNVKITFTDINTRPPPLQIARSYFNDVISSNVYDRTIEILAGGDKIDIPVYAPWFEAWRNTFLNVQYPSDHEFTKHFVGCLLVVSSNDEYPIERLKKMLTNVQELIQHGSAKLPKWFTPTSFVLITFLLVHDNSVGDPSACLAIYEQMKNIYGINKCFFLNINSQTSVANVSNIPDPWAHFLLTSVNYKEETQDIDITTSNIEVAHEIEESQSSPSSQFIVHPLSPVTEENADNHSTHSTEFYNTENMASPQHGKFLTVEDINRIKQFINDFCVKSLIPHFEQSMQVLSDQISNKKGVSRSLFSATKRLFGTSKPGVAGNNISPTAIAYSSDSHELQLRRLGDLAFMIGHYLLAYTVYHGAKRDFSADGAWLHYAGALEMAALSAFMSGNETLSRKVIEYAEESITTYQTACRVNQFATRATLLSVECLKGKQLFGEAAKQLIRMSGEDSDLRSAVLLEQAAYSFLSSKKPLMFRKYAFHMVLAGHRFNKAGHKNHSIRCYYQSYQIYQNKNWSIAEDHILYTIGKQSSQLKLTVNAIKALCHLVKRSSRQTSHQQLLYLQEYITIIKKITEDGSQATLSLPIIDCSKIQILLNITPFNKLNTTNMVSATSIELDDIISGNQYVENPKWWNLEEKLINFTESGLPNMVFKPTIEVLTNKTDNFNPAIIIAGEPIGICINFKNPLHTIIKISDLKLNWIMESDGEKMDLVDNIDLAISQPVSEVILNPDSNKNVILIITPKYVGNFHITGLTYIMTDSEGLHSVCGSQSLNIITNNNYIQEIVDKRLQFKVIEKAPKLQVSFSGLRRHIFSSEIVPITIYLNNIGTVEISKIYIIFGNSFHISINGGKYNSKIDNIFTINLNNPLLPGENLEIPILIFPNFTNTTKCLEILFYYESSIENSIPRYRLIRHNWPTTSHNVFNINAYITKSHSLKYETEAINIKTHIGINISENAPSPLFKLNIECISLYSPYWKLTNKSFTPEEFVITKEESVYSLFQAIKEHKQSNNLWTSINFTNNKNLFPYKFCIPNIKFKDIIKDVNNLHCFINWKTDISDEYGVHTVQGQEYILLNILNNQIQIQSLIMPQSLTIFGHELIDDKLSLKKLIYYQLQYPLIVQNNFNENRLCTVPVQLWLQNNSDDILNVKIDLVTLPKNTSEIIKISECFAWVGRTEFNKTINSLERINILLNAAFASPGAYDLTSRIVVLIQINEDMIIQTCQIEASLIIT